MSTRSPASGTICPGATTGASWRARRSPTQVSYTEHDAFRGAFGIPPSSHPVTGLTSLRDHPF
ncbi:hypothetical protein ACRAWG_24555 [Methylobacterium sp. P31]